MISNLSKKKKNLENKTINLDYIRKSLIIIHCQYRKIRLWGKRLIKECTKILLRLY